MYNQDKMDRILSIGNVNVYDTSDETILTDEMDIVISNMLYDEVRDILNHIYGKDGEYNSTELRKKEPEVWQRDYIRRWAKNKTPKWAFKNREQDIKNNCRIWVLRKNMELFRNLQNQTFREYNNIMFHNVFYNCSYNNFKNLSYKNHRNSDILKYKLMS